jgi:signal transduction histidine kinase
MQLRNLVLAGVLTWVIVALPHAREIRPVWAICYVAFIALFVAATQVSRPSWQKLLFVAAQSVLAVVCCILEPDGMQEVLFVLVAAHLGHHFSFGVATAWMALQTIAVWVLAYGSGREVVWRLLGYFAFQLFGFLAARIAHEEAEARQALAEVNAELRVATGLLEMNSRAEERLRIARDLHDLIGHHLTALSLNLEVASHLTEGKAKEQVEKSRSIAKLLLADVRDVVSRFREHEPVDLAAAIRSLREAVPQPQIHVEAGEGTFADPAIAETALRAVQEIVTNAIRHSNAKNLWLKVGMTDKLLTVDARDDGAGTDRVVFGNGLRGMKERVQQVGGTLEIATMRDRGFEVRVQLPIGGAA